MARNHDFVLIVESIALRQPHGLTPAALEQLGSIGHVASRMYLHVVDTLWGRCSHGWISPPRPTRWRTRSVICGLRSVIGPRDSARGLVSLSVGSSQCHATREVRSDRGPPALRSAGKQDTGRQPVHRAPGPHHTSDRWSPPPRRTSGPRPPSTLPSDDPAQDLAGRLPPVVSDYYRGGPPEVTTAVPASALLTSSPGCSAL